MKFLSFPFDPGAPSRDRVMGDSAFEGGRYLFRKPFSTRFVVHYAHGVQIDPSELRSAGVPLSLT